jgi:hypothetical protein
MNVIVYAAIAVLVILVVAVLRRASSVDGSVPAETERQFAQGLWEGTGLTVAEKIFDRTDYLWLRDKVGFPLLARSLSRSRQQIALKWLKALRRSFHDVVLTHATAPDQVAPPDGPGSWELLWPTLRFHLLLTYATLVVRWFGPYHRLIPPVGGLRTPSELYSPRERYGAADLSNLR